MVKADALMKMWGPAEVAFDPPRGTHIVAGPEMPPMQAAIRYVRAAVPIEERIFVGNARTRWTLEVRGDGRFHRVEEAPELHRPVPAVTGQ